MSVDWGQAHPAIPADVGEGLPSLPWASVRRDRLLIGSLGGRPEPRQPGASSSQRRWLRGRGSCPGWASLYCLWVPLSAVLTATGGSRRAWGPQLGSSAQGLHRGSCAGGSPQEPRGVWQKVGPGRRLRPATPVTQGRGRPVPAAQGLGGSPHSPQFPAPQGEASDVFLAVTLRVTAARRPTSDYLSCGR